jgi:hypothetical protein
LFVSATRNDRLRRLPSTDAVMKDALRFEHIGPLLFGTFEFLGQKRFFLIVFSFFIGSITFDGIYMRETDTANVFVERKEARETNIYCYDRSAFGCSSVAL